MHSLRDWLTRKQRESRRGRAELRLAERAALWNAKPENRHLPSVLEWASIRMLAKSRGWTEPERRMMKRAARVHGRRALGVTAVFALLTWAGIEGYGSLRASNLVQSLRASDTADIPPIIEQLSGYRRWADRSLRRMLSSSHESSREHLHASLALLAIDETRVDYLFDRLLAAAPTELPVIRGFLAPHSASLIPKLWSVIESATLGDVRLLPAASSLALYDPENSRWTEVGAKTAEAMVRVNAIYLRPWLDALEPVRSRLKAPIAAIFRENGRPETQRALATNILTDYANDDPGLVVNLLMEARPEAYEALFPIAQSQAAKTLPLFEAEFQNDAVVAAGEKNPEDLRERNAERQAHAAIALVRMGKAAEVWPALRHSADPRLRSFIVNWLSPLGVDPNVVAAELDRIESAQDRSNDGAGRETAEAAVADPAGLTFDAGRGPAGAPKVAAQTGSAGRLPPTPAQLRLMDAILFHPETSKRRALILAMGTYDADRLSGDKRQPLTAKLLDLYRNDPDGGIHGATAWTLRQWGHKAKLRFIDAELSKLKDQGSRRWFVNGQGQTLTVIEGPVEFLMGSPPTEPERDPDEYTRTWQIPRRFAIATREVTVEQFFRYWRTQSDSRMNLSPTQKLAATRMVLKYSPDADGPMVGPDWYLAAQYCNWLSEREGISKQEWCYIPTESKAYNEGMSIPADILDRTGYRLATDAEWEYACRSGTVTSRYYGVSTDLLGRYARYQANSNVHGWPGGSLLPNDFGLFDMLGNALEWVNDRSEAFHPRANEVYLDCISKSELLNDKVPRLLRSGSFCDPPSLARSAFRFWMPPSQRLPYLGFRVARTLR